MLNFVKLIVVMLSVVVSYFSLQKMDGNDIYIFKRNVLSDFKVQQI
jgi:hypothetical protein